MGNLLKKHSGLRDVRFILAVGSGKGGVGKSTLCAMLSIALREAGYLVGILDLDFYGPNIGILLGAEKEKPLIEFGKIKPVIVKGIKILSLAFFTSEREGIFMRGPMAQSLIKELMEKTEWGPLDFLILDLPPGTGDIFLTVLDWISLDGFILITTAHKLSLSDAKRTLNLLRESNVPILGIVKNMSNLWEGEKEWESFLKEEKIPFLLSIPFIKNLSEKENLEALTQIPEIKEIFKTLGSKILEKIFRIH
ncbi:MAG: Mrp/NBP35 family ATP-binding protein [Thermodesulfobacteriaceae bacterium]|nr:Mrp/NBP35 family ATP-binding protein [Thermodesulfobacteriaceae bacterium]MCX8041096.1 Mrp/NBP35 family ATP-binding protein [Thermodesulfobacteriaceae bacterium]MDW8135537.1 ATP-binding protein [Thermodesulfobacterium sp.]